MSLNELAKEIHQNAVEHGWWEKERSFGEIVALCHSELSEALEEFRDGHPMVWYRCMKNPNPNDRNCEMCPFGHDGTCDVPELELKVDKLLRVKHEYNKTRPYRHGGKKL